MKLFKLHKWKKYIIPLMVAWLLAALLAPNILFVCEWRGFWPLGLVNLLLPLGIYILLLIHVKKLWLTMLWQLATMTLCAFQIVLIFMYGPSPIGVDMFLNVATTNSSEVGELLGNLKYSLILIFVLYLPSIAFGVYLWKRSASIPHGIKAEFHRLSIILISSGLIMGGLCKVMNPRMHLWRDLFPFNAFGNFALAIQQGLSARNFDSAKVEYKFNAVSERQSDVEETYVVMLGETTRADNWQLLGYNRATTPELVANKSVVGYPKTLTQSNTTHKIVPMMLSHIDANHFADSILKVKSFITAFKEAGYHTWFLSNQARNGAVIDAFGNEADSAVFIRDKKFSALDGELMPLLGNALRSAHKKKLIVLHLYGSHYCYYDRYPDWCNDFGSNAASEMLSKYRDKLIDNYDNTVRYTSYLINKVITALGKSHSLAALVYVGDHGEDIFDDERNRFLHASPTPTYWQLHVPMLIWFSPTYQQEYGEYVTNAANNRNKVVASCVSLCHTLMQVAGIKTNALNKNASLVDSSYQEPELFFLNDYNEAIDLDEAGFTQSDFEMLNKLMHRPPIEF